MPRSRRKTTTESATRLSDTEISALIPKFRAAKAAQAKAEKEWRDIQKVILAELDARKTNLADVGDLRVTKIQGTIIEYDPDKLLDLVNPRIFRKVTVRKIDKTLLSAAVQSGEISAKIAEAASVETTKAPYISISNATGE